ncbi:hypothetical protein WAE61_00340 [Comamonadaceae bacterium PP-2]
MSKPHPELVRKTSVNQPGDEHREKVHVKSLLPAASKTALGNSLTTKVVRQRFSIINEAYASMRLASEGKFPGIDPIRAQEYLDATVEIYDDLDRLNQRVERNSSADHDDQLILGLLVCELGKHVDSYLAGLAIVQRKA